MALSKPKKFKLKEAIERRKLAKKANEVEPNRIKRLKKVLTTKKV